MVVEPAPVLCSFEQPGMFQSRYRVAKMVYLGISGATVCCRSDSADPGWTIRISDVVLIAEYTTDEGPGDDYFLVFVTREEGELFYSSVTLSASGINPVLEELEKQFECSLELKLASVTHWASRVLWPPQLAGSEYLEAEATPPPHGLWGRLLGKVRTARPAYRVSRRILQILSSHPPLD
jgi:hypothetical protein